MDDRPLSVGVPPMMIFGRRNVLRRSLASLIPVTLAAQVEVTVIWSSIITRPTGVDFTLAWRVGADHFQESTRELLKSWRCVATAKIHFAREAWWLIGPAFHRTYC